MTTDLRDKFYALLPLTLDGNELVPTPNYTQHPDDVFKAATFAMLHDQGQAAVMLLAGERGSRYHSWLPDWSNLGDNIPPWIIDHVLHERQTLDFGRAVDREDKIAMIGAHFDTIGHTSGPEEGPHIKQVGLPRDTTNYLHSLEVMTALLDALTACKYTGTRFHDPNASGSMASRLAERKSFELSALYVQSYHLLIPDNLKTWYEYYRLSWIHGATLHEWFESRYDNCLKQRWKASDPQGNMKAYMKRFRSRGTTQEDFKSTRFDLWEAINDMIKHRMKIVITRLNRIAVVAGAAQIGDLICRVDNCGLAIVLRRREQHDMFGDKCRFVGEVLFPAFRDCDCDRTCCDDVPGFMNQVEYPESEIADPKAHRRRYFWIE